MTFVLRVLRRLGPSKQAGWPLIGTIQCLESGRKADVANASALLRFLEEELEKADQESRL